LTGGNPYHGDANSPGREIRLPEISFTLRRGRDVTVGHQQIGKKKCFVQMVGKRSGKAGGWGKSEKTQPFPQPTGTPEQYMKLHAAFHYTQREPRKALKGGKGTAVNRLG